MSELIKTLNLLIINTQVDTGSHLKCDKFSANTRLLPCYLSPSSARAINCESCAFNTDTQSIAAVKILSKFHE